MMMTIASRCCWSVGIVAIGLALSAIVTLLFAQGLRAGKPILLDSIGTLETIQLPQPARKNEQIHSFVVKIDDVDDFSRVFINNYLVLMSSSNEVFDGL